MLVQTDLSQAELRVMAALSGDQWMLNALQEGQGDFFDQHMMPVCFPNEDLAALKNDPIRKKELRTQVKTVQYGLAFGRKAPAIAVELGLHVQEAQGIIDNYFSKATRFAEWREEVMEAAVKPEKRDMLITPFGRKYQSEIVTHKNEWKIKNEALSFLPQSTASDICLVTAIRIHPQIKQMGGHIVALVHDAIIVEIHVPSPGRATPEAIGGYIQQEFRKTGEMVFGDTVPFLSEFSVGRSWGDLV
jgi:DNA polymerase-1